ncbi:MAG: hypothetical protein V9F00_04795 [Nocardioides sp.]
MTASLLVEYIGEEFVVGAGQVFTIGRDADLVVDEDNPYLHRRIVEFAFSSDFWWISNVGSRLPVTVSGQAGTLQSLVGPGSRLPVVLPHVAVLFTAGETTYEVNIRCEVPTFDGALGREDPNGELTLGAVSLTSTQFLLILALSEPVLRRLGSGASVLPSNARAADRLGWPITTFNRKLDNVCVKFSQAGVRGLRGVAGQLALQRRARLVEYAVSAKIVRPEHLPMLDQLPVSDAGRLR